MKLKLIFLSVFSVPLWLIGQGFQINFSPSPGDAVTGMGTVGKYVASWAPTNLPPTNGWKIFQVIPAGQSNFLVPSSVPSPSLILVQAKGTNGIYSTNQNNFVMYNTNASWVLVSNNFTPPAMPSTLILTN